MFDLLVVAGIVLVLIGGTILTLVRGVLVDRTRARNKEFIMFNYGGLTGWPTEGDETDGASCGAPSPDSGGGSERPR